MFFLLKNCFYLLQMVILLRMVTNLEDRRNEAATAETEWNSSQWKRRRKREKKKRTKRKSNKVPTGLSASLVWRKLTCKTKVLTFRFKYNLYWFCRYARMGLTRILLNLPNDITFKMVRTPRPFLRKYQILDKFPVKRHCQIFLIFCGWILLNDSDKNIHNF